jgi:multidrug efflux pump subunit AcrB
MPRVSDHELVDRTHNTARFFTERRSTAWVLLLAVIAWGVYGYVSMPKQKDPDIPVRVALAVTPWPGASAEKIEQLVTRPVEERIAQNTYVRPSEPGEFGIKSLSLPGVSIVEVQLAENVADTRREFNDIGLRLGALNAQLPQGAGPIQFNADFGETAGLMLTVASPPESPAVIALRAQAIERAIVQVRPPAGPGSPRRVTLLRVVSELASATMLERVRDLVARHVADSGLARDVRPVAGPGFVGLDAETDADAESLLAAMRVYGRERLGIPTFYPDAWLPVAIVDPRETEAKLTAVAGPRYTYRELDDFTRVIQRALEQVPQVSSVQRSGVLPEQVVLEYSQARLAAYGVQPPNIRNILAARSTALPGGVISVNQTDVTLDPSGEFKSQREISGVMIGADARGNAVYLRDLVEVLRGYQSPPQFLNYYSVRDAQGTWRRTPAVTLAVQMRPQEQIAEFGRGIDAALSRLRAQLPPDLIVARTSDQPRQVRENIDLFMNALWEAIVLVVLVALVGFWEWRSAVLMALSIPLTLAMTFGMTLALGVELHQVSIATLIIALGLLVDDPVVAGDAIKRELGAGQPRAVAAWLGPTKLAKAIMFATVTNIAAYLPFLLLQGVTGEFLRSLPIVMTCALVASRLVSMTFVPLLGYYLLRPPGRPARSIEELRRRGVTGLYYRVGVAVLNHRWKSCVTSLALLAVGVVLFLRLPTQFFPLDLQYLAYVDIWLPNNVALSRTDDVAARAVQVVQEAGEQYAREHPDRRTGRREIVKSVTAFVGGGSPRFWYSLTPEPRQKNYAQLVIEVTDKEVTGSLVPRLQAALAAEVDGARVDVRQLETSAVGIPIQIQVSGGQDTDPARARDEMVRLRQIAGRVRDVLRAVPLASGVRDDWDDESFAVKLQIDADRANLAGVTNQDVAVSAAAGISGDQVGVLREGDRQIPIVAQLRLEERARLADVQSLYVYATGSRQRAPLSLMASVEHVMETQRIRRVDHFRTITVQAFPAPGAYASQVMDAIRPGLAEIVRGLPPGYTITIGGAEAKEHNGFAQVAIVMAISIVLIFVALTIQFNHPVKPILVFAAVPYGALGALAALWLMGEPFGFMGFLGIASLVGVIVSHVIVLFDFIEENHARGEPLVDSLLDAGIVRLRPVMITTMATLLALVPLAVHGGPLWQPLCYAQIGGLALATFIELLLVKVFYVIFVVDLKLVRWDAPVRREGPAAAPTRPGPPAAEGALR